MTSGARRQADQALAVPATPLRVDGPTGFDPSREHYIFTNGWTMRREGGHHWHLRDSGSDRVDHDQYRHDLIERYDLVVAKHHDPLALGIEARRAVSATRRSRKPGGEAETPNDHRDSSHD